MSLNPEGQPSAADEPMPAPAKIHRVFAKANLPANVQKVPGRHTAGFFWPQDRFADAMVTPEQLKAIMLEHYRQVLVVASVDGKAPEGAPGEPQIQAAAPSVDKSKIPSAVLAELAAGKNEISDLRSEVRALRDHLRDLETDLGGKSKAKA